MTLSEAYRATLDYNARLQGERARAQAEREGVSEAWSGIKPKLEATAALGSAKTYQVFSNTEERNSDNYERYDVTLNQVIYSHKSFTAISRAKRAAELAGEEVKGVENDTAVEVINTYIDVVRTQRLKNILSAEKESHLYRLQQVEEMLGRGLTSLAEVLDARAEVDQIKARLVEVNNSHRVALQALSQLTGQAVDAVVALDESYWKDIPALLQQNWLQAALEYSPKIRKAEAEVALAEAGSSHESAGHYPELYLYGRYSDNDTDTTTLREESKVELQLRIPLYSGGGVSARARGAALREARALSMLDYARRQVKTEVEQLTSELEGFHDNINALFQSLASSRAAENAAQEGFNAGVRRLKELLDAQQRRSRVEQELVNAIYESNKKYASLLSLSGKLNLQSVQQWSARSGS
nr:TolC family protein [Bacterioplanes sanyensis]